MTTSPTTRSTPVTRSQAVAVALVLLGGVAVAQSPAPPSPVTVREQLIREQCRREAAEWEERVYQTVLPPRFDVRRPTADEVTVAVMSDLHDRYTAARVATFTSPDRRDREQQAVAKRWEEVMTKRVAFAQAVETRQRADGFDWATREVPPVRLSGFDFALLGVGAVAVAAGGWLALRRYRIHLRRRSRARAMMRAAVLIPFGWLAASGCSPTATARPWADIQVEELTGQLTAAKDQADRATEQADQVRREALTRWRVRESDKLLDLRGILAAALTAERMTREAAEEQTRLDADEVKLETLSRSARQQGGTRAAVGWGVGLLFVAAAVGPYLTAVVLERARRKREADTCPRCLSVGKMKEKRTKGGRGGAVIECGGCGYRCQDNTRQMARLCFPTVGIRASGKTHLLATAYASVKNRNTRTAATVQQAPSMGDEQFNTYIELLIKHRATAGATVHALPAPIVVCVRDTDRGGANTVLVNLFDYSGEMMTQSIQLDDLRRRAVRMDGFLMFFDPTQMYGDEVDGEATLALEDQLKALHEFYQDMLAARGLPPGAVVPVPVAVCVSKFDLVATRSPMGGQALPFLNTLKEKLDPPGEVSLGVLRVRSELVEQMLPFMLPGADLRKILKEYFGDQFLFFPTSDRGMGGGQGGAFGVVEPLLWLLHMHGYCVLKDA